jgi:hypothetical protein
VVDALGWKLHELHATSISMCQTDFKGRIFEAIKVDLQYMELVKKSQIGKMQQKVEDYKLGDDGIVFYKNIIYAPNSHELRGIILKEMHDVPYVGHPGYHKTIATVKSQYCSPDMKKEIVEYIAKCMECQNFKAEHRHPTRLLQPFPILKCIVYFFHTIAKEYVERMQAI